MTSYAELIAEADGWLETSPEKERDYDNAIEELMQASKIVARLAAALRECAPGDRWQAYAYRKDGKDVRLDVRGNWLAFDGARGFVGPPFPTAFAAMAALDEVAP